MGAARVIAGAAADIAGAARGAPGASGAAKSRARSSGLGAASAPPLGMLPRGRIIVRLSPDGSFHESTASGGANASRKGCA